MFIALLRLPKLLLKSRGILFALFVMLSHFCKVVDSVSYKSKFFSENGVFENVKGS